MSIIKVFMDAFKKASTPKVPDAREHARNDGLLGPTNQDAGGSFEPLQRTAPAQTGAGAFDVKVEERPMAMDSSDPEEGGEIALKIEGLSPRGVLDLKVADEPEASGETAIRLDRGASRPQEDKVEEEPVPAGEETAVRLDRGATAPPDPGTAEDPDLFKVEIEEIAPASLAGDEGPGGVPVPYPNSDAEALGDDLASVARKAGEGQQEYLKVTMNDALVTSRGADGGEAEPEGPGEGLSLGRHLAARGAAGRSRPFRDADDDGAGEDEGLESGTIVDLKVEAKVEAMHAGLSGDAASDLDADADFDVDDDAADPDDVDI